MTTNTNNVSDRLHSSIAKNMTGIYTAAAPSTRKGGAAFDWNTSLLFANRVKSYLCTGIA